MNQAIKEDNTAEIGTNNPGDEAIISESSSPDRANMAGSLAGTNQFLHESSNDHDPAESVPLEKLDTPTENLLPVVEVNTTALVQALLMATGQPLLRTQIIEIVECESLELEQAIEQIKRLCESPQIGFELVEVGPKKRLQLRTKSDFAEYIQKLKAEKPKRLSRPALETLAIVAYRQPLVKSDIERIRGVDSTPTLKTLLERNLVKIVGYQDTVGHPALYSTTEYFLEVFGLEGINSLPPLHEVRRLEADPGEEDLEQFNQDPAPSHEESIEEKDNQPESEEAITEDGEERQEELAEVGQMKTEEPPEEEVG